MKEALRAALEGARAHLPEAFREAHRALFEPEHLDRLAGRLAGFHVEGVPAAFPPPHLAVEETIPYAEAWSPFAPAVASVAAGADPGEAARALAAAFQGAGTRRLLVLLGQRQTPGSLLDERAIPPTRERLLAAVAAPFHRELTVAGRALTKHVHRTPDLFWGEVTGSDAQKSEAARVVVVRILDAATWWNVFEHYLHAVVFEAREPSGYGARWGRGGETFIGFLEPFTPGFPHVRDQE